MQSELRHGAGTILQPLFFCLNIDKSTAVAADAFVDHAIFAVGLRLPNNVRLNLDVIERGGLRRVRDPFDHDSVARIKRNIAHNMPR